MAEIAGRSEALTRHLELFKDHPAKRLDVLLTYAHEATLEEVKECVEAGVNPFDKTQIIVNDPLLSLGCANREDLMSYLLNDSGKAKLTSPGNISIGITKAFEGCLFHQGKSSSADFLYKWMMARIDKPEGGHFKTWLDGQAADGFPWVRDYLEKQGYPKPPQESSGKNGPAAPKIMPSP